MNKRVGQIHESLCVFGKMEVGSLYIRIAFIVVMLLVTQLCDVVLPMGVRQ
jgi:hypothetical protein